MLWPNERQVLAKYPAPIQAAFIKARVRSAGLKRWSAFFLVMIVATLAGGFYGILEAPRLARLDVDKGLPEAVTANIEKKYSEAGTLGKEIVNLQSQVEDLRGDIAAAAVAPGQEWTISARPTNAPLKLEIELFDIALSADGKRAIAVGDSGTVVVSPDGGDSWNVKASGIKNSLYNIALSADGKRAIAVGDNRTVVVSPDGGDSWDVKASGTGNTLSDIALSADGKRAIAVGDNGTVVVSPDGGDSWDVKASDTGNSLFNIALSADGKRAIAVGDNGTVVVSPDGGDSWDVKASGTGNTLYNIALSADDKRAIAVGRNLTISRSLAWDGPAPRLPLTAAELSNTLQKPSVPISFVSESYKTKISILATNIRDKVRTKDGVDTDIAILKATGGIQQKSFFASLMEGEVKGLKSTFDELQIKKDEKTGKGRADLVMEALDLEQRALERAENSKRLTTMAVRIGVIAVVLLLVQIFVSQSRYNMRLAAYYDARADALLLIDPKRVPLAVTKVEDLEALMNALSPDGVDFGKGPKSLLENAVQLAQGLGRRAGGRAAG